MKSKTTKVNYPAGKKMNFGGATKVSRKAPVRGQSKNVAVYHMTKGKRGKI